MSNHKILKIASPDPRRACELSAELKISPILSQLLINRDITTSEQARKFLKAGLDDMHDPYDFSGMNTAVELIRQARQKNETVMVFGDYDADGITSLALIKGVLSEIGIKALHYLPHRVKEGYGLTANIAQVAKDNKVGLLITVDCGITNHRQVSELKRQGIKTIITDHHEPPEGELPEADCILNPKVPGSGYPFRDLAGVGVAYKLCQALTNTKLPEGLDLVSLGTIADNAPLTGENRIIAREGLAYLPRTTRPGLSALIDNAGIRERKFNSTYVSFILAPRINASGRMGSAEESLELLMTSDLDRAKELAKALDGYNRQRQKVEGRIMQEAQDLIDSQINFKDHKVIVIAKEDWHQGVLGIVASKIADKFYRPAIVISLNEELCKGSARSIKNFHLFDALRECKGLLDSFGGHAHAAGLLITRDNIDDFKENINRLAHERLTLEDLLPSLDVDVQISLADLNEEMIAELNLLEPFGNANPEPLFYTRSLRLKGEPLTLSRETLKFWATDGVFTYQAIGFGMSSLKQSLEASNSFDLVYTPRMDSWRDDTSLILEVKDIFLR